MKTQSLDKKRNLAEASFRLGIVGVCFSAFAFVELWTDYWSDFFVIPMLIGTVISCVAVVLGNFGVHRNPDSKGSAHIGVVLGVVGIIPCLFVLLMLIGNGTW